MSAIAPLLAVAYFGAQYYSVSKVYTDKITKTKKLPKGPSGEVTMTKDAIARYRAPPGGTTVFKPLEHPDWRRFQPHKPIDRTTLYARQSKLKHDATHSQIELDKTKVARNLPPGTHFLDWNGNGRFPSYVVDRYATSHETSRDPTVQELFREGRAAHSRPDTRVGGYS